MNYYKRFMGDYQRDTGHLSLAAHGAFTVLLDHYYSTRKPLPASLEDLYRLCRAMTRQEQTAVRTVAEEFFPLTEDGWRHNGRADREIESWLELSQEASAAGKRGAAKRWHKHIANPMANPIATPPKNNGEPYANPNGVSIALQRHSHNHSQNPDPELRSESEVDRRGKVKNSALKPVSAEQLLAQGQNGLHAGQSAESAEIPGLASAELDAEAAVLRRVVLEELSRGATAESIIRLMPGRGLTVEQISQIQRESAS